MKIFFAFIIFIAAAYLPMQAQTEPQPAQKELFQIFLEQPVQKVIKMEHTGDEGGAIDFNLSPDGKSIHLLNYKGTGGVKAEVVNMDGNVQEISRSKCYIHSLQEL